MKLLITGGAGFIGSNFIHYWIKKYPEDSIINLDALTYAGNLENLKDIENPPRVDERSPRVEAGQENYKFIKINICEKEKIDEIISTEKPDAIIHFAAESHVDRSILGPEEFVKTNVLGTFNLLESARQNGNIRFHHISTDEVFGSLGPNDTLFNETTPYDPRSPYSASKASSDHLVRAYFHTFGLPITISNCSNNYGPFQFPEKLMPLFITNLIENKKIPLYGDGMNVRDWLFVEDHCEAIDLILQKGKIGETYCVGGNCEKTNKEITYKILELLGKGEEMIEFVADRKGHDRRYAIDSSKIQRELGWAPKNNFESGIKKTIDWYQKNEAWWKKIKSDR
ncbi:MAG: dTDP-glucose 4,6-dehydratase [Candidatus Moranbacteria bacterium RIFOXYA12_FULL_35_19]|nr:MAG: dTDP-glucose 4,6-dehydratase [Candidatus Moranbacteria bacterium GW2011_GWF2_35_39]OGI30164.1 MAG: dTDP-glucose 4,6-dehydratase [Candidatus Moranbacteria bacterium RIFOXYB12_FULL_35_8]OGI33295.1 MAG: dTDP-glucose 4,6-dehydratase [Candidatus Moranbacteria bacterium RIFOXYC12_FULL_36_13]OGI36813.1 MAG: dTDP-glucose 4,6-dehydratase [Candidatus Moranbacteria bacterium RIFOXYA12_FULL_35_19]